MAEVENINFEEMVFNPKRSSSNATSNERGYKSLYEEIEDKLRIENYLGNNYDEDKVNICNDLLFEFHTITPEDSQGLRKLRDKCISQLHIKFSAKEKYEQLEKDCNPAQFSSKDNYDKEKIALCNKCYAYIQKYREDVQQLEKIEELESYVELKKILNAEKERKKIEAEKKKREEIRREEIQRKKIRRNRILGILGGILSMIFFAVSITIGVIIGVNIGEDIGENGWIIGWIIGCIEGGVFPMAFIEPDDIEPVIGVFIMILTSGLMFSWSISRVEWWGILDYIDNLI